MALTSPSILRVSAINAPDFLSKLSISSRIEITVGSNSPPYLSLARPPRKSLVLSSASSTAADAVFGGRDDAGDLLAIAGQRGGERLEIPQRILYRHLVVDDDLVDVAQRHADLFLGVERPVRIGGQLGNAVRALWRRRRLVRSAGERDRRDAGQPLEFEADLGVAFHRRVAVDHGQRHDAARMVELQRHHLADPDAGEIHAAALAQARGRTFEDHPERHLLLGAGEASDSRATPPSDPPIRARVRVPIIRLLARALMENPGEAGPRDSGFAAPSHRRLQPAPLAGRERYADAFRDATNTPVSTSAKPMKWNACGCSPRKTIDMTVPNTGTTWKNGAARLAPISCTPRLKQR